MQTRSARLMDHDGRRLASLLEAEEWQFRRLLRLAWRQNSYMKRQDVHRLEANGVEWARYLPAANAARLARETLVADLFHALGGRSDRHLRELLPLMGAEARGQVRDALAALQSTTARLARQNALNRHLAEFCLDLAQEETRVFRDLLQDEPAGCYGADANTTARCAGGVLVRQA